LATQRPDPFGEIVSLRDAMSRLMEESFIRPRTVIRGPGAAALDVPIDLYDTGDAFVLRAMVPGARPEDVQPTVLGNTLQIKGHVDMHQADPTHDVSWLVHEVPHGAFIRTITLPQRVDPEGASATFEAGILTLRLPKAEESRPRQIKITTANQSVEGREPGNG